jgi:hypothetical protein
MDSNPLVELLGRVDSAGVKKTSGTSGVDDAVVGFDPVSVLELLDSLSGLL